MKHQLKITTILVSAFLISPAQAGFEFVPSYGQQSGQYQKAPRIEPLQPVVKNRIPIVTAPRQQSFMNQTPLAIQQPQYQQMPAQQANPNPPLASLPTRPQVSDLPTQSAPQQIIPSNPGMHHRQVLRPQPIVDQGQQQSKAAMNQMMRAPQQMPRQQQAMSQGQSVQTSGVFAQGLPKQQMQQQSSKQPFPDYVPSMAEVQGNLGNNSANIGVQGQPQQMANAAFPQNNYVVAPSVSPIETGTIPVYSELEVYGEAYDGSIRRAPKKKKTLFSINPFPFGDKQVQAENQQGLLFGRPVSVTNDTPPPVAATGPYSNSYQQVSSLGKNMPTSISANPVRDVYNPGANTAPNAAEPVSYNSGQTAMASSPMTSEVYDDVVGFGNDIPLPIALSQVVPDNYSFSYDDSVNLSQSVSWEGGKPWNQVLQEMLSPHSLRPVITDSTVRVISNAQQSAIHIDDTPISLKTMSESNQAALLMHEASPADDHQSQFINQVNYDTTIRLWSAPANATLRRVIDTWAAEANVQLHWTAEYDYPLQAAVNIRGTFVEAVEVLLNGLRDAQPRPVARLHPNLPDGPPVLVLETRHIIR